jgi:hypothetical protein
LNRIISQTIHLLASLGQRSERTVVGTAASEFGDNGIAAVDVTTPCGNKCGQNNGGNTSEAEWQSEPVVRGGIKWLGH